MQTDQKRLILIALLLLALVLRVAYWQIEFPDFIYFLDPWLNELRVRGPSIIGTQFAYANYHPPYLYIIWFFSLFVPDNISVIKLVGLLGDIALAGAVYGIVRQILPQRPLRATIGAVLVLCLPTVLFNSAVWGQCDAIYSAFLLYAVLMVLKKKLQWAWIMFAVVVSFKTQGLFLLPFMGFVTFYHRQWRTVLYGVVAGAMLLGMPIVFGVPAEGLIGYYMKDFQPMWGVLRLSWWCPNLMSWLPNEQYGAWRAVGLVLFGGLLLMACYAGWRRFALSRDSVALVALAALSCMAATFVLPQVHGRYYFPAEILLLVLVLLKFWSWWPVMVIQLTTMTALVAYFVTDASDDMWPYRVLSVPMALVVGYLIFTLTQYNARGIINHTSEGKE